LQGVYESIIEDWNQADGVEEDTMPIVSDCEN